MPKFIKVAGCVISLDLLKASTILIQPFKNSICIHLGGGHNNIVIDTTNYNQSKVIDYLYDCLQGKDVKYDEEDFKLQVYTLECGQVIDLTAYIVYSVVGDYYLWKLGDRQPVPISKKDAETIIDLQLKLINNK